MRTLDSRIALRSLMAVALTSVAGLVSAASASAVPRTSELPIPLFAPFQNTSPATSDLAAGPDGNVWFAQADHNALESITPAGVATEIPTGFAAPADHPSHLTAGSDGAIWFTITGAAQIGRMTTEGVATAFTAGISATAQPSAITLGPDGNVWFAESNLDKVARITPAGTVTEFAVGGAISQLVAGGDGALWMAEGNQIDRLSTDGLTFQPGVASLAAAATGLTWGPDDNLWATTANSVVRVTPSGATTSFTAGIDPAATINDIATASDGNLWYADAFGKTIGRVTPAGALTAFKTLNGAGSRPFGLVPGPAGTLWYSAQAGQVVGRVETVLEPSVDASIERKPTTTSMTLVFNVNPQGAATSVYVDWGPTKDYGTSTATTELAAGIVPAVVSVPITGLAAGTTYHFRIRATNAQGASPTADETFVTSLLPNPDTPVLPTPVATPSGGTSPLKPGQIGGGGGSAGGAAAGTASVTLGAKKAAVSSKGIVKLPLACGTNVACNGVIVVSARVKGPKSKLVSIGTKPVRLAAGGATKLGIRVSSAGRRALRSAGSKGLSAVATISVGAKITKVKLVLKG